MMDPYRLGFMLLGYGILGGLAYGADLRWGVGVRGFCLNLIAPEPSEHSEGFLVGRDRSVQFFWSAAISLVGAVLVLVAGAGQWYFQLPMAVVGAVACLGGMRLSPLGLRGLRRVGLASGAPAELTDATGSDRHAEVDEPADDEPAIAMTDDDEPAEAEEPSVAAEAPPPAPTAEELRQQKIDRMDALLGKKKGS